MDIVSVLGEIGILPEYREVTGTPRGLNGPTWALVGKRRGGKGWAARPSPLVRIGQGEGGGAPLSFLSPSSFPPSPTPTRKEGSPTPSGSRTPPWRALLGRPPPPPWLLYIRGQGAPLDTTHKLIYGSFLSRVRCPPPPYSTLVISSWSLGEALRR